MAVAISKTRKPSLTACSQKQLRNYGLACMRKVKTRDWRLSCIVACWAWHVGKCSILVNQQIVMDSWQMLTRLTSIFTHISKLCCTEQSHGTTSSHPRTSITKESASSFSKQQSFSQLEKSHFAFPNPSTPCIPPWHSRGNVQERPSLARPLFDMTHPETRKQLLELSRGLRNLVAWSLSINPPVSTNQTFMIDW